MGIDSFLCAPNAISKAAGPLVGGGGEGCAPPAPTPEIRPGYIPLFIFNCFLSIAYINLPLSFIWCKENNYRLQITNGKPSRSMRETDKKIHGAK